MTPRRPRPGGPPPSRARVSPRPADAASAPRLALRTPPPAASASERAPAAGAFPEPLYLDNHLLVVVKPAGLLSQADRTGDLDLVTAAKAYLKARFDRPGDVFVGLVHRLDRPVSGVLVLARTSKAAARLSEQFRTRTVAKHYLALVEGRLDGAGRRTDWLRKDDEVVRLVAPGAPGGREATLGWRALWTDGRRTLVSVALETGRAHQIRVQLAALGHPIVGDGRHGASTPWTRGAIALHAASLEVEHPTQRVPLAFAAPPDRWRGVPADALAAAVERVAPAAPARDSVDAPGPDRSSEAAEGAKADAPRALRGGSA